MHTFKLYSFLCNEFNLTAREELAVQRHDNVNKNSPWKIQGPNIQPGFWSSSPVTNLSKLMSFKKIDYIIQEMKQRVWLFLQVRRGEATQKLRAEEKMPMSKQHTVSDRDSDLYLWITFGFTETGLSARKAWGGVGVTFLLRHSRSLKSF